MKKHIILFTISLFQFSTQHSFSQSTTTSFGYGAGVQGSHNTNIGFVTGPNNRGESNTFIGAFSGAQNNNGNRNTFLGRSAGSANDGSGNVFIGASAGAISKGSGNIFIGRDAGKSQIGDGKLYIDNTDTKSPLIYGDFMKNLLTINGTFDVAGDISGNSLTISTPNSFLKIKPNATNIWSFSTGNISSGTINDSNSDIFMNVDQTTKNVGVGNNSNTRHGQFTITSNGIPLVFENPNTPNNSGGLWRFFQVGEHVGFDVNTGGAGNEFGNSYKRPLRMSNRGTNGRVGIGLNFQGPSYELDVNGKVRASAFIANSDKRFKQNIQPITKALDKINAMAGVSYQFNTSLKGYDLPSEQQFGLIAQDVQKVMPDIVHTDENGYLGIDYIKVIPLLIEAVKEQHSNITKLEEENKSLKEVVQMLLNNKKESFEKKGSTSESKLYQNMPNPLVNQTLIKYELSEQDVTKNAFIEVYDFNGNSIKKYDRLSVGENSILIPSNTLRSKVSFYRLVVNGEIISTKKMITK